MCLALLTYRSITSCWEHVSVGFRSNRWCVEQPSAIGFGVDVGVD